jgi:hypothetical protein
MISYGRGACVDNLPIELSMQPDGQVYYTFRGTDGAGILHHKP